MDNLAYADEYYPQIITELIAGKIVMMSPRPRTRHMEVSGEIFAEFRNYLKGKKCRPFMELDVYLDEENRYIPDVMIVCNPDIIKDDGIHGAPDLIVEVLSPSTAKYDRGIKKDIYEQAGVKEYWIVDTFAKSIEAYHNISGRFRLANIYCYYTDEQKAEMAALPDDSKYKVDIYDVIKVSVCDNLIVKLQDIFY